MASPIPTSSLPRWRSVAQSASASVSCGNAVEIRASGLRFDSHREPVYQPVFPMRSNRKKIPNIGGVVFLAILLAIAGYILFYNHKTLRHQRFRPD